MRCRSPFKKTYPCGKCPGCLVNRRRLWKFRLLLEATQHLHSWFVTLTYADTFLPAGGQLSPRELKLFLMKLRTEVGKPFRYFAVGEYGEKSCRPHYHLIVYGLDPVAMSCVQAVWGKGFVDIRSFGPELADYICGYVLKKMTSTVDPRLQGKCAEFQRMSRRPGIGAPAIPVFADWVNSETGVRELAATGDVPFVARTNGRIYPIGRYLRSKIRELAGYDSKEMTTGRRAQLKRQVELLTRDFVVEHGRAVNEAAMAEDRIRRELSKRKL